LPPACVGAEPNEPAGAAGGTGGVADKSMMVADRGGSPSGRAGLNPDGADIVHKRQNTVERDPTL